MHGDIPNIDLSTGMGVGSNMELEAAGRSSSEKQREADPNETISAEIFGKIPPDGESHWEFWAYPHAVALEDVVAAGRRSAPGMRRGLVLGGAGEGGRAGTEALRNLGIPGMARERRREREKPMERG